MKRSKWRTRFAGAYCDPILRSWLTEPDSLTARCQRASSAFRVRLLRYGQGRALADEAVDGGIRRHPAWVREVVLECDGVPVIFAHTTLSTAIAGRMTRWMAGLGSRSLGSLLFSYPGFKRGGSSFSGSMRVTRFIGGRQPWGRYQNPCGRAAHCTDSAGNRCW